MKHTQLELPILNVFVDLIVKMSTYLSHIGLCQEPSPNYNILITHQ